MHKRSFILIAMVSLLLLPMACTHTGGAPFSKTETRHIEDSPEARQKAVDRYFKAISFHELRQEMFDEMSKRMPDKMSDEIFQRMINKINWDLIESAAKESLKKHMTAEEITVLAEFVEQPAGKSAMKKMKFYMADLMPVLQQELYRVVMETIQEKSL